VDAGQDEALARALRVLQESTAGVEGVGFLAALARGLALAFEMEYALVGELDQAGTWVHPLAVWGPGGPTEMPAYALRGTPCADAVAGAACLFPYGARARYPEDAMLVEMAIESYAGVPVRGADGQAIGLIAAFDRAPRPGLAQFDAVLAVFASRAGWNIERARLEQHLRRGLARAHALARIATDLHTAHARPDEAFQGMCAEVRAVLEASAVSVTLLDEGGRSLERRAHVGLPPTWLERHALDALGWLRAALERGERMVAGRAQIDRLPGSNFYRQVGLRAAATVPMRSEGRLIGFLSALQFSGDREFGADDVTWLEAVAGLLVEVATAARLVAALRSSEQRYRRIVTTTHEGVWTVDAAHRTTFVNQRMAQIVGREEAELLGRPLLDFVAPEDHALVAAKFAERRGGVHDRYEHRFCRKDGARVTVQASTSPLLDEDGRFIGALAMVRDVTELRQLEARMLHAQKLESLGVLAGGVAHDFNNLLVGILGNVGLARAELAADAPAQAVLRDVQRAATRAADLTAQMLAYAGKGRFVVQRLGLNRLIGEVSHLMAAVLSKRARLHTELAADLPDVEGDAPQLRQVVMNLIANAGDALGDEPGLVTVRTSVRDVDPAALVGCYADAGLKRGRYVCLTVADTGPGFDEATQARIFDPFFTTKFAGRGLGLAAVLGILRGHRGAIQVESAPGRGARFHVLLPSASPTAQGGPRRPEPGPQRAGLVLIADDEPAVRTAARRVLERAGLTVCVAGDGREAIAVFTERQAEIQVVLLDMTMPHLRGDEVYRALRRLRPDVRVVLTSGFSDPQAGDIGPGAVFLPKPWTPQELLAAVFAALDRA